VFEPLKGLRVIDLTQVLAGPYSTYQLALMGAEVIKVENPDGGDWTRAGQSLPGHEGQNLGASYLTQNGNKKSIAIDLKTSDGVALLKRLVASADIFVENYRPGTAARLGLSFDDLTAVNEKLLYCSISAYGQDGPISHRAAYDHVVQGMCGIMTTTGTADTAPNKVGSPYIDYVTGLNGAFAITAALHQIRATGKAIRLDVAMLDSAMLLMSSMLTQSLSLGMEHTANGNEAFSRSPASGAFKTSDGTLMIAANNERQFQNLCKGLNREDLLTDPRWATLEARTENNEALRAEFNETVATQSADHWEQVLSDVGVPAARVRTLSQVLNEDQLKARELMTTVEMVGASSPAHVPSLGFKVDGDVTAVTRPPARLGEDTDGVLTDLGLDAAELTQLKDAGIINSV
jgi:crotonobetainyl-CoA:carnitine CoA-transferase CaiB-like acyl-CoA transferase